MPSYPIVDEEDREGLNTVPPLISPLRKISSYEAGKSTNIQSQMNVALSVAENILHHPASVRKVSVKPGETTKTGMFLSQPNSTSTGVGVVKTQLNLNWSWCLT